jgi:putative copper resistance protein D
MQLLLDVFGLLSVLLRGAQIATQSLLLGGLVFLVCLVRPLKAEIGPIGPSLAQQAQTWCVRAAVALFIVICIELAVDGSVLSATAELSFFEVIGADFFLSSTVVAVAALAAGWFSRRHRDSPVLLLTLGAIIVAATALTSHAAARIDLRPPLLIADFLHQAGAAVWIGGIPYFLLALAKAERDRGATSSIISRYSRISMIAVAALTLSGVAMGLAYIDSLAGIYGTAYGTMLATKVAMFLGLLCFGFMNLRIGERLRRNHDAPVLRLRRFAEVEVGIGLTVFFAAASLTSLPPATDLRDQRVTAIEIMERFAPQMPSLTSPDHATLGIPHLQAQLDAQAARDARPSTPAFVPGAGVAPPSTAADLLWSEYNHHWAGILVLAMGLLGLLEKSGRAPWARHWPLLFLVLAAFLLVRSDPEVWPLGQVGFFDSFRDPEVLQHRIFVLLIVAFGVFEWRVRTGRTKAPRAAFVFPLMTAIAGALLLTHSHSLGNIKAELLIEWTHTPLALLGVATAWARWLEIRLAPDEASIPGWTWRICFVLIGLLLLDYREA